MEQSSRYADDRRVRRAMMRRAVDRLMGAQKQKWVLAATLALAPLACTDHTKSPGEPVTAGKGVKSGTKAPTAGTKTTTAAATPGATPAPASPAAPATPAADDGCRVFDKLPGEPPFVVPGKGLVVTKLLKPCLMADGRHGFDHASPWLAMAFPCTGGAGRIDFKGHANNPKMAAFILGTDCGMAPSTKDGAEKIGRDAVGLPPESKLVALNPFVVQYWEVPGFTDADVGFTIELRSSPALEGAFKHFKEKNAPIHVTLFGRENAWVGGEGFYQVEADLKSSGRAAFMLDVTKVKALTPDEVAGVKERCERLSPKRNCAEVF